MSENENKNDIVVTTDYLEAVSAFRGMKNFLFVVTFICLLVLQGAFWAVHTGYCTDAEANSQVTADPAIAPVETDTATQKIKAQAAQAAKDITTHPGETPESPDVSESGNAEENKLSKILIPKWAHIAAVVKAADFIIIVAAVLYCLTLFMSIKISLTGRLGGINHISRAFLLSLFVLVFLLPWQIIFPSIIAGAVYTPKELLIDVPKILGSQMIGKLLYYLRFSGLWVIVTVLLICAQLRSIRWAKATLRRLGIPQ